MSFDVAVWHETDVINPAQAQARYESLAGGEAVPSDQAVAGFVERLTTRYPQIDDVDEDELDDCPWSCAFDYSGDTCVINMRWDMVDDVLPEVVALAMECGLLCYDPQNGRILTDP